MHKVMDVHKAIAGTQVGVTTSAESTGVAKLTVLHKELTDALPQAGMQEIRVIIARLEPGDRTSYHSHRFPVTVYMLEGVFTLELDGRNPIPVRAGERVLAIPGKIGSKREVQFLTRNEIEAILSAPDRRTWVGRRDHVLILTAVQTGMRLSELVGLDRSAVTIGTGAHIRCFGKGRKERTTPLTKILNVTLKTWLDEPPVGNGNALFPTVHGERMSPDTVQYLLAKYVLTASKSCSSLRSKRISPHVLRHSAAMELLDAGVDSTVISLWLGHESTRSTQPYLHAHLAIKEAALAKIDPFNGQSPGRFRAGDELLAFLDKL
jgi:integrase/recombinase XerD